MAIDKRLLDDIAPSDSAVSRLKNRSRRIKPWESDVLLRSPDVQESPGNGAPSPSKGTPSRASDSTNGVLPTEAVLPTTNELPADSVPSTIPALTPSSVASSMPEATTPLAPTTEPAVSNSSVLRTEAVPIQQVVIHGKHNDNRTPSDIDLSETTKSVLSTKSVLRTGLSSTTTSVVGSGSVPPTKLDTSTESGSLSHTTERSPGAHRNRHDTKRGLSTDEKEGHQSVLSTDAESSYQSGATRNNRSATSGPPNSAKRVQPYVISETENFTRVPHAVTEALQREDFSSRQFRILVTILRETLGWGREYAELSAKDLAKKTGIAASHIFITLRDLEDDGAIIRRTGGKNAKNCYALNRGFFAKYTTKRGPEGVPPTSTDPVLDTEDELTTASVPKLSSDPVRSTHHQSGAITTHVNHENHVAIPIGKKESKKLKNSLREVPEILRGFIESTRPAAKLESERECAFELLAEYSAEDIAAAVNHLRQNGVLGTGEPCHSPFRYLLSAAEQVLAQVSKVQEKRSQFIPSAQPEISEAPEAYAEALPLFENRLSDDAKRQYIAKYIELELPHGFLPPQGVLRKLVALRWYAEQQSGPASTLKLAGAQ